MLPVIGRMNPTCSLTDVRIEVDFYRRVWIPESRMHSRDLSEALKAGRLVVDHASLPQIGDSEVANRIRKYVNGAYIWVQDRGLVDPVAAPEPPSVADALKAAKAAESQKKAAAEKAAAEKAAAEKAAAAEEKAKKAAESDAKKAAAVAAKKAKADAAKAEAEAAEAAAAKAAAKADKEAAEAEAAAAAEVVADAAAAEARAKAEAAEAAVGDTVIGVDLPDVNATMGRSALLKIAADEGVIITPRVANRERIVELILDGRK